MTMSKQDFEVIAERILTLDVDDETRAKVAAHFADGLRSTNGMFNRDKFVRACMSGQHIRRSILPRP